MIHICGLFYVSGPVGGRGPLPRQAASAGEQVTEAQVVCQVLERLQMPIVGPHPSLPPTPYGDGIDAETTGDLHP